MAPRTRSSGFFKPEVLDSDEGSFSPAPAENISSKYRGLARKVLPTATASPLSASSVPTPTTNYSSGSEYSTPMTSHVPTPAASVPAGGSAKGSMVTSAPKLGNRIEVQLPRAKPPPDSHRVLQQSIFSMNSKRKRPEIDDSEDDYDSDDSPDAKFARILQDEEDKKSHPPTQPLSHHPSRPLTRGALKGKGKEAASASKKPIRFGLSDDDEGDHVELDESDSDVTPARRRIVMGQRRSTRSATDGKNPSASLSRTSKARGRDLTQPDDGGASDSTLSSLGYSPSDPGAEDDESDALDDSDNDNNSNPALRPATTRPAVTGGAGGRRALGQRTSNRGRNHRRSKKGPPRTIEDSHPELKNLWSNLRNMPAINAGKAEQPKHISRKLMPFQLEGLAWMKAMETREWKGGILGDEMGLGKTIQAVSLIMSDWPAKQPSLVLVPPVAMMQWMSEIKSYTDGNLKALFFHGTNAKSKNLTAKDLKGYDVVIMSYNSLESMYRKQEKGFKRKDGLFKEESLMHRVHFHRVILDEAHSIKSRSTMTAKACFALNSTYRWCLTGTPLQNRIGEFFSLVRFLNIQPFASYFCRKCPCSTLEWSVNEQFYCTECSHAGVSHVSVFNTLLLNPIHKYGNVGPGAEALQNLRLVADRIMLRRLKKDHTDSMELPVKEVYVDRQFFGEEELDFANSIMSNGQRRFDTYVAQGVVLNNYANIFGLIMQMRQVADHPDLILKKNSAGGQNVLSCCICDDPAEQAIRSKCKHDFCRPCVTTYLKSSDEPDCPRCHIPLSIDLEQPEIEQDEALVKKSSIINRINMAKWTSSSKIELLVHELHKLRSDNSSHKSIIFSQFTTMLQLIEWRLRRAGITTVMLDGSMNPAQRQASIDHFMNNTEVECFLVSMKAGGIALNLTEASHVFIVDPWWNPAAEWQSADRCHRPGQNRPCIITRLCIEDSVESRMVLLQEKKTSMINSTINADDAAMESLDVRDMAFLFRGN